MPHNLMGNFQREISYRVSCADQERMLLTATMRDVYHDIVLEVVVRTENLTIQGAQVEFHRAPEPLCPTAAANLEKMVGVVIGKGLTKAISHAMGGSAGCVNLRHLLSGLLPLAMNVKAAAGFNTEREMLDNIKEHLAGACAGYPRPSSHGVA